MKDTVDYDNTAKLLHWLPVFLIAVQFPVGWMMTPTGRDELPTAAVNFHFSMGILILAVLTVRLGWRLLHPVGMEPSLSAWQKKLAEAAHWSLYAVVFGTLISGWAHASVHAWPIKFFGLIPIPGICPEGSRVGDFIGDFHKGFGLALLALISIHIAGVMFHEFVQGDKILERMLPRRFSGLRLRNGSPDQA